MAIGSIFNFSVSGPGKQFNVSNLYKNFGTDLGESWLMSPDSNGNYTLSGSLLETFTTSGTYTPGSGISHVDVVIVSGGYTGKTNGEVNFGAAGGAGGSLRVFRNVPVAGPVSVVIGGVGTASSFGSLIAPSASGIDALNRVNPPLNNDGRSSPGLAGDANNYFSHQQGIDGISINGTYYGGGGGGGGKTAGPGGAGGGGSGGYYNRGYRAGSPGQAGTGGGGGGGGLAGVPGQLGGTGRVMVFEAM